jgi:hypothetical protein
MVGDADLGVEKHQIEVTVIYAGNRKSRFRIDGAKSL